jgi:hypothetical protein
MDSLPNELLYAILTCARDKRIFMANSHWHDIAARAHPQALALACFATMSNRDHVNALYIILKHQRDIPLGDIANMLSRVDGSYVLLASIKHYIIRITDVPNCDYRLGATLKLYRHEMSIRIAGDGRSVSCKNLRYEDGLNNRIDTVLTAPFLFTNINNGSFFSI